MNHRRRNDCSGPQDGVSDQIFFVHDVEYQNIVLLPNEYADNEKS